MENVFHQFIVSETNQDSSELLWWPNGDVKQELKEYRMKMDLFGLMSLYGSASSGLKYIGSQEKEVHPSAFIFTKLLQMITKYSNQSRK